MRVTIQPDPPPPPGPVTPRDLAVPQVPEANEPGADAEMLVTIKNSDALAKLAGMDPEMLESVKKQEWHEHH